MHAEATESDRLAARLRAETRERAEAVEAAEAAERDARERSRRVRARRVLGPLVTPATVVAAGFDGSGPGGARVPLAGFPLAPDAEGDPPVWRDAVNVGGVVLPAALCTPPSVLRWRVRGPAVIRAFAALRPESWAHNRGGVRFSLRVGGAQGDTVADVTRELRPGTAAADREWAPLTIELNGGGPSIVELRAEVPAGADPDYAWALWGDPVALVAPPGGRAEPLPSPRTRLRALRRRRATPVAEAPGASAPSVSLLLPVHDPAPELLRATLGSVFGQTDGAWQLCVADDGSSDPQVLEILREAAMDPRVELGRHDRARGIAAATNLALSLATGAYVATLDHDDLLTPGAITLLRSALAADPDADIVYSDNDKVGPGGERFAPSLKPGWSPELLNACMYTLHLSAYRRSLVEAVGGWRTAFDGAQDHDLLLRLSERTARIRHLPETLYSWRAHVGSASLGALAKPEAYERGMAAVTEHLDRTGVDAVVTPLPWAGRYRVVYAHPARGVVAAVAAPTAEELQQPGTAAAIQDLTSALDGRELVLVLPPGTDLPAGLPATVVPFVGGRWGDAAIAGCAATDADVLILVQELGAPEGEGWLEELSGPLDVLGVRAAAPVVLDAEHRVVHAGVALTRGLALPVYAGTRIDPADPPVELTMAMDRAALSGVVAVRREALAATSLHGRGQTALMALTAALTAGGGRAVCTPHAPWRAAGAAGAAGADLQELRAFADEHRDRRDPWRNPRLWADRADHSVPWALQHVAP